MEAWGWAGTSIILYDGERLTDAGREQIKAMQDHLGDSPNETISVPAAWLKDLFVQTPADKLEQYMSGLPIVVSGVVRENQDDNPKHRPPDHEIVKTAKQALRVETFRLTGRQTGVEIARNTRARQLTEAEAKNRAVQTIATATWRGGSDTPSKKIVSHFNGLIDRGRRLAATFFNVAQPQDLTIIEQADVLARKAEHGVEILDHIEQDNIARVRGMAWNEAQARVVHGAMAGWSESVRSNKPIGLADGNDLTNARPDRMTASALMKVAIAGDLNPADIHMNFQIERPRFAVGQLIGQMSRGGTIELQAAAAKILKRALATFATGRIETQADSCDILIADAALACYDPAYWSATLDRILDTGISERIAPKIQQN
jgi:hypothetical protein